MTTETLTREESGLSASLRTLAQDVRRLIAEGQAGPHETAAIARRIAWLRGQSKTGVPTPLHRWLDNLQHQVEHAGRRRVAS